MAGTDLKHVVSRPIGVPTPLPDDFTAVLADYADALAGSVLTAESRRTYRSRVRQFLAWLDRHRDIFDGALVFATTHDCAVRDYHHHLCHDTEPPRSSRYINSALAAIDDFSAFLGLAPIPISREDLGRPDMPSLDDEAQGRWLRAAHGRASSRDTALALTAWYLQLRVEEITSLNTSDIALGSTDRVRDMPAHVNLRRALRNWLTDRSTWRGAASESALFLNRRGGRLSSRSVYNVLGEVVDHSELSGVTLRHVLRHGVARTDSGPARYVQDGPRYTDFTTCRLDASVPNVARVWDVHLGGKNNFAVDRDAAAAMDAAMARVGAPTGHQLAAENRAFLRRAVRYLSAAGVRQFIDVGVGLPSGSSVHSIAAGSRVVYVDYDPVVVAHAQALLAGAEGVAAINGDLRDPSGMLGHPDLTRLIDFDRPVAVLMIAVLHLVGDAEDPHGIVACLRDAVAPGSYLALTHNARDADPRAAATLTAEFRRLRLSAPMVTRSCAEIGRFFSGLRLVEPGLVPAARWRPAPGESGGSRSVLAGVGLKL
jgi:integrase